LVGIVQQFKAASAMALGGGISHNGEEPGARMSTVEAIDSTKRTEQGLLKEVLSVKSIVSNREGNSRENFDLGEYIMCEGVLVATAFLQSAHPLGTPEAPLAFRECMGKVAGFAVVVRACGHRVIRKDVEVYADGEGSLSLEDSIPWHLVVCRVCCQNGLWLGVFNSTLAHIATRQGKSLLAERIVRFADDPWRT
jgi:hypothetical protein